LGLVWWCPFWISKKNVKTHQKNFEQNFLFFYFLSAKSNKNASFFQDTVPAAPSAHAMLLYFVSLLKHPQAIASETK